MADGWRKVTMGVKRTDNETRSARRSFMGLGRAVTYLNQGFSLLGKVVRLVKWPAIIAGVGALTSGLSSLTAGFMGLVGAVSSAAGVLATLPGIFMGLFQLVGAGALAFGGVTSAIQAMSAAQKANSTSAGQNAQAQRSAANGIRSAEQQLISSHQAVTDAQKALTAAREEARRQLLDMRLAELGASLGQKQAMQQLHRARQELFRGMRDPSQTPGDLKGLRLAVQEAELGVRQARTENRRAEEDYNKAESKGVHGSDQMVQARRALADAQRQAADATRGLADAQKQANEQLDQGTSQSQALQYQMQQLSPVARKFAKFIYGLKPQFQDLKATAAENLFPGLTSGIKSAMRNLPAFNKLIGHSALTLGRVGEKFGKFLGRKGFGKDLVSIGRTNDKFWSHMSDSLLDVADGIRFITKAAKPLVNWLGKMTEKWAEGWKASMKAKEKGGELTTFFDHTKDALKSLGHLLSEFTQAIINIGSLGRSTGMDLLDRLGDAAEHFRKWTESAKGRNVIKEWFDDAEKPLIAFGRLLHDITVDFFKLGGSTSGVTTDLIQKLRTEVLPVFVHLTKVTTKAFGPALIDAIVQLAKLFGHMAGATGPLTLFVKGITLAAKGLNWIIKHVFGLGTIIITALSAASIYKLLGIASSISGVKRLGTLIKGLGGGVLGKLGLPGGSKTPGGTGGGLLDIFKTRGDIPAKPLYVWVVNQGPGGGVPGGKTPTPVPTENPKTTLGKLKDFLKFGAKTAALSTARYAATGLVAAGSVVAAGILGGKLGELMLPGAGHSRSRLGRNTDMHASEQRAVEANQRLQRRIQAGKPVSAARVMRVRGLYQQAGLDLPPTALNPKTMKAAGVEITHVRKAYLNLVKTITARVQAQTGIRKALEDDGKVGRDEIDKLLKSFKDLPPQAQKQAKQAMLETVNELQKGGQLSGKAADKIRDKISGSYDKLQRHLKGTFEYVEKNGTQHFKGLNVQVSKSTDGMVTATNSAITLLTKNVNKALRAVGIKQEIQWRAEAKGTPLAHARQKGGPIVEGHGVGDRPYGTLPSGSFVMNRNATKAFGFRSGGEVPVALEPGEKVFYPHEVKKYGMGNLALMNSMVKRKDGGAILEQGLGPYTIPPIQYDPNHAGGNSHLHLDFFTTGQALGFGHKMQSLGWQIGEYTPKAGNPFNFGPITTHHESPGHYDGTAFDANTPQDETRAQVAQIARMLGGAKAGLFGAGAQRLARVLVKGPKGPLQSLAQAGVDKYWKGAQSFLDKHTPSVSGTDAPLLSGIQGSVAAVFAKVVKKLHAGKTAALALFEAGFAESGMRDLDYGDASSTGSLQLLASTAAGMGIDPHDEAAVASAFLLKGFYGNGGAISIAREHPELAASMVAQMVQGSATSDGSNYAAQKGAALALMRKYGLAKGGAVLIGDSLGVGMRDNVGFPGGWDLAVSEGKSSGWGLSRLQEKLKNQAAVMFEIGTNDANNNDISGLRANIASAKRLTHKAGAGFALMTTAGVPNASDANKVIRGAGADQIANWAGIADKYGANPHVDVPGYRAMQKLVKNAVQKAKDWKGATGQSDDGGKPQYPATGPVKTPKGLGQLLNQYGRSNPKRRKKVMKAFMKKLQKGGVPQNIIDMIDHLDSDATKYDTYAQGASDLASINPSLLVHGYDEKHWLTAELQSLWGLRGYLLIVDKQMKKQEKELTQLINKAERELKEAQKKAKEVTDQLKEPGKTPKDWKGPDPSSDPVTSWNDLSAKKRTSRRKDFEKSGGKLPGGRAFTDDDQLISLADHPGQFPDASKWNTKIDALKKVITGANRVLGNVGAALPDEARTLELVQGLYGPKGQMPLSDLVMPLDPRFVDGDIHNVQMSLANLGASVDTSALADLYKQLWLDDEKRLAVSAAQAPAFAGIPQISNIQPLQYGGIFHKGLDAGPVPGRAGEDVLITAQAGEWVAQPDQLAAPADLDQRVAPILQVIVEDGAVDAKRIRAIWKDEADKTVSRAQRRA